MESLKEQNRLVGLKQSKKAVQNGQALRAYVAGDADEWVIEPFIQLCRDQNVEVVMAPNMKELAKACHVEVPTAVCVIL